MIQIRPESDLRNKYTENENIVHEGQPKKKKKNGYGNMVVMSLEAYANLTDPIEAALDEADAVSVQNASRLTHDEVFNTLRGTIHE